MNNIHYTFLQYSPQQFTSLLQKAFKKNYENYKTLYWSHDKQNIIFSLPDISDKIIKIGYNGQHINIHYGDDYDGKAGLINDQIFGWTDESFSRIEIIFNNHFFFLMTDGAQRFMSLIAKTTSGISIAGGYYNTNKNENRFYNLITNQKINFLDYNETHAKLNNFMYCTVPVTLFYEGTNQALLNNENFDTIADIYKSIRKEPLNEYSKIYSNCLLSGTKLYTNNKQNMMTPLYIEYETHPVSELVNIPLIEYPKYQNLNFWDFTHASTTYKSITFNEETKENIAYFQGQNNVWESISYTLDVVPNIEYTISLWIDRDSLNGGVLKFTNNLNEVIQQNTFAKEKGYIKYQCTYQASDQDTKINMIIDTSNVPDGALSRFKIKDIEVIEKKN